MDDADLLRAVRTLQTFTNRNLKSTVAALEKEFAKADGSNITELLAHGPISEELLSSALLLKRVAGQVHVIIHAVGILLCLPHLLAVDEQVETLSLGAGSTGKPFDLETNLRIAEFKFIQWQTGSNALRENALFKDLYRLAEHPTAKRKYLYVLGLEKPMRFFTGGRALKTVMSGSTKLWDEFRVRNGERFSTVREWYKAEGTDVVIEDISRLLPLPSLFLEDTG